MNDSSRYYEPRMSVVAERLQILKARFPDKQFLADVKIADAGYVVLGW